ncbi:zinc finger protein with KRAB and SCAN domains 7-like [Tachyglossus aculeatus]|uniref:zinc finger protein with KRAB and SCAN domains 7-like n=1 Tax=Tachyglossus aculeatus TaxID=9261 RepID=UPI0018F6DFEF|nr:zinc finger protein with KRAB and SCAN domains 7-like [Tachyglossus aculeatus]
MGGWGAGSEAGREADYENPVRVGKEFEKRLPKMEKDKKLRDSPLPASEEKQDPRGPGAGHNRDIIPRTGNVIPSLLSVAEDKSRKDLGFKLVPSSRRSRGRHDGSPNSKEEGNREPGPSGPQKRGAPEAEGATNPKRSRKRGKSKLATLLKGKSQGVCPYCGRRFPWEARLGRKQEEAGRPYNCGICGRGFARPLLLKAHLKFHTKATPFFCGLCGQTFKEVAHLSAHLSARTQEGCHRGPRCPKSFPPVAQLTDHPPTHRGLGLFRCSKCGKSFTQRSRLLLHQNVHHGQKPYFCLSCTQYFQFQSKLGKPLCPA